MLFPILQALWQLFSPQATQILNSPEFRDLLGKIPQSVLVQGGRLVTHSVYEHFKSLTPEEKERLQNAAIWVAKDMAGDVASVATGLPIGPLVDLGVEKLFGDDNASKK